jgi:hypothetical protein
MKFGPLRSVGGKHNGAKAVDLSGGRNDKSKSHLDIRLCSYKRRRASSAFVLM